MNNLISQSVKVPHRSGHYLGHHFLYTAGIGEAIPVLCQPLAPGSRIKLKTLLSASLAPLASDTFLHASMRLEAFAVPLRFLYGGYESWVTRDFVYPTPTTPYSGRLGVKLPRLAMTGANFKIATQPGKLLDYLGVRVNSTDLAYIADNDTIYLNIFPLLAYQYIWDTWYRRSDVQVPYFRRPPFNSSAATNLFKTLPFVSIEGSSANDYSMHSITIGSSDALLSTWQRNFPIDYFTSAMVSPQLGDDSTVDIVPDSGDGHFTIAALRAANSLQVYRERMGLCGQRFSDWLRGTYGTDLNDSNGRRPMYLGSSSVEFYNHGVDQAFSDTTASMSTNNPFKSVGARYGQPMSNGESNLVDDFTCDEPCYLVVIATAVPKVMYSSGVERYMLHYTKDGCEADLANPILQNVGNQEIKVAEISPAAVIEPNSTSNPNINSVFGYRERYSEYMYRNDRVSGLYRDGSSLASFVAQRYVGNPDSSSIGTSRTTISDAFLRIPKTYLDQVSAVSSTVSTYGVMVDMYFDFGVSQILYDSSIPSLVNPAEEHGKDVVVMRGGKRII